MQAQFHPPEVSLPAASAPGLQESRGEGYNAPAASSSKNQDVTVSQKFYQAAKTGEFRAIATLLDHYFASHNISTWVGEAGPGYLQITLTVKHPPQRKPLVRFIAYQLYQLRSDVILGAHITVKLAATSLILWHQLVRLPLPETYKTPSPWTLWKTETKEKVQSTWATVTGQLAMWYGSLTTNQLSIRNLTPTIRGLPWASKRNTKADKPPVPDASASVMLANTSEITEPSETTQEASQTAQAPSTSTIAQEKTAPSGNKQRRAVATLLLNWLSASSSAQTQDVSDTGVAETTASSSVGRQKVDHFQASLKQQIKHPNPWLIGGIAMAAFTFGGGIETINAFFSGNNPHSSPPAELDSSSHSIPPQSLDLPETEKQELTLPMDVANEQSREQNGLADDNMSAPNNDQDDQPWTHQGNDHSPTVQTAVGQVEVTSIVPETARSNSITLTFTNDAIVPLPAPEPAEKERQWQWPFTPRPESPITHTADLAIALLSTFPQKPEAFPGSGQPLQQGGIDLVNIASNGVADADDSPLSDTLQALENLGIPYVGAGANELEARQPQVFGLKGQRIAVLGYVNGHLYAANDDYPGTNPVSLKRLVTDIEAIRNQVDWVIVTYHWHGNLTTTPTEQQIELAHAAVDNGADLVVGYHPNLLQGTEIYKGRAIAYSLGPIKSHLSSQPNNVALGETPKTIPHDLPSTTTGNLEEGEPTNGIGPGPSYSTTMLKVILGERHMEVGFIPVQQTPLGASFTEGPAMDTTLQQIQAASASFKRSLEISGMTYLPLEPGLSNAPSSSNEAFRPARTEPFIDNKTEF